MTSGIEKKFVHRSVIMNTQRCALVRRVDLAL
jgi:hypothetical protein